MRIGVISDTHILIKAQALPEKVVVGLKDVDMIIHCGDLVDLSVLAKLKALNKNIKAVWGNMDPYDVRGKLPEKELFKVGKFKIGIMHGFGAPKDLIQTLAKEFKDDQVDIIAFGHSHSPTNEKIGKILFFNPGSCTDKTFAPYNSYGIIEINDEIKAKIVRI